MNGAGVSTECPSVMTRKYYWIESEIDLKQKSCFPTLSPNFQICQLKHHNLVNELQSVELKPRAAGNYEKGPRLM